MTPEQHALVLEHEGLVRCIAGPIARNMTRGPVTYEDVLQAGRLGLCDAVLRWDGRPGVPFGAYARRRIHGAIVDTLRRAAGAGVGRGRKDWTVNTTLSLDYLEDCGFDAAAERVDLDARIDGARLMAAAAQLAPVAWSVVSGWARDVPWAETARELGLSENSYHYQRSRAFKALRASVHAAPPVHNLVNTGVGVNRAEARPN